MLYIIIVWVIALIACIYLFECENNSALEMYFVDWYSETIDKSEKREETDTQFIVYEEWRTRYINKDKIIFIIRY